MNKKTSVYGGGLKKVENEQTPEEKIIATEGPTVEEVTGDLEEKGSYPPELFNEEELPGMKVIDERAVSMIKQDEHTQIGHYAQRDTDDETIRMVIPWWKPWKGSGRLVVQGFRRTKTTKGGIIMVNVDTKDRIPADTKLYVVAKDPDFHGINLGDMVQFAEDFRPTGKMIDDVYYYIPHWQDVLLIDLKQSEMDKIVKSFKK